jgi:CRP/FNR family transcriptional regulator
MEVKGRIADVLLELQNHFGVDKQKFIRITLSRQDIASYAGTIYETVFKFFVELIKENIISTSAKKIKINDPGKLSSFIGRREN